MTEVLTFEAAIAASAEQGHRHLFLGNGFSIACKPNIFSYAKLFERADFQQLSDGARDSFGVLKTQDFERVIRSLRSTLLVLQAYRAREGELGSAIAEDAERLREVLVHAISESHPARPIDITDAEYESCRRFLARFERVYSLSYDLLLYWAQMHEPSAVPLNSDDGFRKPEGDPRANYVVWDGAEKADQTTYYLHGALHLIDTGTEIRKLTWANTGVALVDQIQELLTSDQFPLFVSEGTSREKVARIRHSDYLVKAFRSLRSIQGALFVFGFAFSENDDHILTQIERGKISHLFVSLFGDPASDGNRRIIRLANAISSRRPPKKPLTVQFYSSDSAHVWR